MEQVVTPEWLATVIGIVAPFFVKIVKAKFASRRARYLFAVVFSFTLGAVGAWASGVPASDIVRFAGWTAGISQVVYSFVKGLIAVEQPAPPAPTE
ncbi:MAG TPA: hypothetical protein PLE60_15275 [Candidatus Latescibacteria bacterium]|nr:hypothetical protein [Candidatus Latescibacterota bacterium]